MRDFLEMVNYWPIGLYEGNDMSVKCPLGMRYVAINKYVFEDEDEAEFAVDIETAYELTSWHKGEDAVLHTLVEYPKHATHDIGDFDTIATFQTYEEALAYAQKYYPRADLTRLIKEHYADAD